MTNFKQFNSAKEESEETEKKKRKEGNRFREDGSETEEDLRRKNGNPEKKDGDRENPDDVHKTPCFPENSKKFKRGSLKPNENCNG